MTRLGSFLDLRIGLIGLVAASAMRLDAAQDAPAIKPQAERSSAAKSRDGSLESLDATELRLAILRESNELDKLDSKQWFQAARTLERAGEDSAAAIAYRRCVETQKDAKWLTDDAAKKLLSRSLALGIRGGAFEEVNRTLGSEVHIQTGLLTNTAVLQWRLRLANFAIEKGREEIALDQLASLAKNTASNSEDSQIVVVKADLIRDRCQAIYRRRPRLLNQTISVWSQTGPTFTETQDWLEESEPAAAERLVVKLMECSGGKSKVIRESAASWAGETGRWHLIALVAEGTSASVPDPSRTIGLERLFAESWMQQSQLEKALPWWRHLADDRRVNDFPTLLRAAEAEVAVGDDLRLAKKRIEDARHASAGRENELPNSPDSRARQTRRENLLRLVEAQWCFRAAQLSKSREILSEVIRRDTGTPSLAARAQWLIGESFFLQRKYEDSIESYRRVESLDNQQTYVPLALFQSAKAFERLGRTREATICYDALVRRFAQCPQAAEANRRLAELQPKPSSKSTTVPGRF